MQRMAKGSFLFTDGAHAWKKLVQHFNAKAKMRVTLEEVVHAKGQYTRRVKNTKKKQAKVAGTQSLDRRWGWLKT